MTRAGTAARKTAPRPVAHPAEWGSRWLRVEKELRYFVQRADQRKNRQPTAQALMAAPKASI